MLGYRKDKYIYLRIPKNACTTYGRLLTSHGWDMVELSPFEDYSNCVVFGHIRDPQVRHIMGLSQYLNDRYTSEEINHVLKDPVAVRLIMSGVFDQHTFPISMLLGPLNRLNIHWIPIDVTVYSTERGRRLNGDDFTNDFFSQHDLGISASSDKRFKVADKKMIELREKILALRPTYREYYGELYTSSLTYDVVLYHKIMLEYIAKYNKG